MPKITAHGKILRDWDALLGAVEENASLLPGVDDLKTGLAKLLEDGRAAKVRQSSLGATRQTETQNVNRILADGAEMARKLRAFVFSHLGSRTDLVKQFGLPITRKSKKPKSAMPPPTTPPPPAVTPTTEKPPAGGTTPAVTPQTVTPQAIDPGAASESHRTVK